APTSLNSSASGASPIPTESITTKNIRLKLVIKIPPTNYIPNNFISISILLRCRMSDNHKHIMPEGEILYKYPLIVLGYHVYRFVWLIYRHVLTFLEQPLNQLHFPVSE